LPTSCNHSIQSNRMDWAETWCSNRQTGLSVSIRKTNTKKVFYYEQNNAAFFNKLNGKGK
jgi:hypothetical protein